MIDNKTPHLGLPLPDLKNQQDEDVPRIARALASLDEHAAQSDAQMAETESRVETLEEEGKAQLDRQQALDERLTGAEAKLPGLAGSDKAGIVKIGKGIDVTGDGTVSVKIPEVPLASSERPGLVRPDGKIHLPGLRRGYFPCARSQRQCRVLYIGRKYSQCHGFQNVGRQRHCSPVRQAGRSAKHHCWQRSLP